MPFIFSKKIRQTGCLGNVQIFVEMKYRRNIFDRYFFNRTLPGGKPHP